MLCRIRTGNHGDFEILSIDGIMLSTLYPWPTVVALLLEISILVHQHLIASPNHGSSCPSPLKSHPRN